MMVNWTRQNDAMRGRQKEVQLILRANRAAAVGRLMLGEIDSWDDYVSVKDQNLESLPRRKLKSGAFDVKSRLSKHISKFCNQNFAKMTESKLALLFLEIQPPHGLRIPILEFEGRFSRINENAKRGCPDHTTVSITLWGLQFEFPEDHLAKDLRQHVSWAREANAELAILRDEKHSTLRENRERIANAERKLLASVRASLFASHSLLEAYFNGLGWDFLQSRRSDVELSRNKRELLEGNKGSIRDKALKFPKELTGIQPEPEYERIVNALCDELKPFRDSLAHPSPFSAPERFGGYDKLSNLYSTRYPLAELALTMTCDVLVKAQEHVFGADTELPNWLADLNNERQWMVEHK